MAKKYTGMKKKNTSEAAEPRKKGFFGSPGVSHTPEQKRGHFHLAMFLIAWIIITSAVYMTAIQFEFVPILYIYTTAGAALFVAYAITNGGVGRRDLSELEKPPEMGYDEFNTRIEGLKKRLHIAKYLLAAFIPFPFIMIIDFLIIHWTTKYI